MIAALSATVIAAGAIAVAVNRDDTAPPRLALAAAGSGAETSAARASLSADTSIAMGRVTYVVDGTLPALSDHAPVWKVVSVPVDQDRVTAWARLLHIDGEVRSTKAEGGPSWEVSDSHGSLSVSTTAAGTWVSMSSGVFDGSAGSAGDPTLKSPSGRISSDGSPSTSSAFAGCARVETPTTSVPSSVVDPPAPEDPATCVIDPSTDPTPVPPALPVALPDADAAKTIARDALTSMGVLDGDWTFTVDDGGAVGIASESACGPAVDCIAPQPERYVLSRFVTVKRVVEGTPVDGLEWSVQVGDRGALTNVNGRLATLDRVGDYPLRTPTDALHQLESDGGRGGPIPMGAPEAAIAIDCPPGAPPCPDAPCPELCPEQLPITVHVTDVALGAQLWFGSEPSSPTQYVVPMYRFTGHTDTVADWPIQGLALGADALAPPATGSTVPPSSPNDPAPTPGVKPDAPTTPR